MCRSRVLRQHFVCGSGDGLKNLGNDTSANTAEKCLRAIDAATNVKFIK